MAGIDHVTITAADFQTALRFYDAVLPAVGLVRLDELVDEEEATPTVEAAGWGRPDGARVLWLVSGSPATTGLHLGLAAHSQGEVETFFRLAVRAGGTERSAPRRWPIYRRGEFNAMVVDPGGNVVEAVAAE